MRNNTQRREKNHAVESTGMLVAAIAGARQIHRVVYDDGMCGWMYGCRRNKESYSAHLSLPSRSRNPLSFRAYVNVSFLIGKDVLQPHVVVERRSSMR